MSPVTHFLTGWSVAATFNISKKERLFVTIAGIAPDIDGVVVILDLLRPDKESPLELWSKYHHILGHNIGFGLFLAILAFALSARRWLVSFLVTASFHLHLLCDLLGSRGPDGYQWPIPYLLPFSDAWQWTWAGQWQLNAWQNFVFTGIVMVHMFYIARNKEVSPLEIISSKANTALAVTLQRRFGIPDRNNSDFHSEDQ